MPFLARLKNIAPLLPVALFIWTPSLKALEPPPPLSEYSDRWNWFVKAVYDLHKKQTQGKEIITKTRIGGYMREPEFYKEVKFIDKKTDRLISTILWERKNPQLIHSIEVLIYDEKGRVTRDYSATFLTHSRSKPQQTLINLHAYNGDLWAFRQFDATDERITELCRGKFKGKNVDFVLDDQDIIRLTGEPNTIMTTPEYEACFSSLPLKSAGEYLIPK